MNLVPHEIIKHHINNYLFLNDKINLELVNKRSYKIQKKIINYHIGEIIVNKLGSNLQTIEEDMKLFSDYKLDFLNEVKNICLNEEEYNNSNNNIYGLKIPLRNLLKISRASINECKKIILTNELTCNNYFKLRSIQSNHYKKKYYTSYALLF